MNTQTQKKCRNIAIVAHVDHGKTTLVDKLLAQSGTLGENATIDERMMDSNDLERERGITILAKNTAINWNDYRINIVDTPGHADFGGEVERILSMVDSVLLLVDAVDGPMPQTRFVTQKAFEQNLNPIVVVNKIDRQGARPDWAVDQVFDLFVNLGATDEQLDFPIIYASAIQGIAKLSLEDDSTNMDPLFNTIIEKVSPPDVSLEGPFQMQISALDYSSYVGTIGIGRINRGILKRNMPIKIVDQENNIRQGKVSQILDHLGLSRYEVETATAGDIVCVAGIDRLTISDTLCDPEHPEALPALKIDDPTITMTFQVNDSPFAGKDGKYLTSRHLKERLDKELLHNVALRVEPGSDPDKFKVSGRGELHLSILLENMRREGYELAVSRPEVIIKEIDGQKCEPFEIVSIDVPEEYQGAIMKSCGERQGNLQHMQTDGKGRVRLDYIMPSRALIGFHGEFLTLSSGSGLIHHIFDHYGPIKQGDIKQRSRGVLISNCLGVALGYSLFNLQERGDLFVTPQTNVYEGMIVGLHTRNNDLVVNPTKAKQLTNVRASGTDDNIVLTPHTKFTLEKAIEFIEPDELVEVTPSAIRLRKKHLKEFERKRASRSTEG